MKLVAAVIGMLAVATLGLADEVPILVSFDVSVSGGNHPTIDGHTNLPDGTPLIVSLQPPMEPNAADRLAAGIPACSPNCMAEEINATVEGGRFEAGPFGRSETGLNQGSYKLEVTTPIADLQPSNVQERIGHHGEYLAGPYAIELIPGMGKMVYYISHVNIP